MRFVVPFACYAPLLLALLQTTVSAEHITADEDVHVVEAAGELWGSGFGVGGSLSYDLVIHNIGGDQLSATVGGSGVGGHSIGGTANGGGGASVYPLGIGGHSVWPNAIVASVGGVPVLPSDPSWNASISFDVIAYANWVAADGIGVDFSTEVVGHVSLSGGGTGHPTFASPAPQAGRQIHGGIIYAYLGGMLGPPNTAPESPDIYYIPPIMPEGDSCKCCNKTAGKSGAAVGSVHYFISLGGDQYSTENAGLELSGDAISHSLFTPNAWEPKGSAVAVKQLGITRQFISATAVADVVDVNAGDDTLDFVVYHRDMTVALLTDGSYPVPSGAVPIATYTVTRAGLASLSIVKSASGASSETWQFTDNGPGQPWTMVTSANGRTEQLVSTARDVNGLRTETRTVTDALANVVSSMSTTFKQYPFGDTGQDGEKVVSQVVDPGPAGRQRTSTWAYYDNQAADGAAYGKVKLETQPSGSWRYYVYDTYGRVVKAVSQFHNNAFAEPVDEAANGVVEISYPDGSGEPPLLPAGLLTTVVKRQGVEVRRSYRLALSDGFQDIQAALPGAGHAATANSVTEYHYHRMEEYRDQPKSVRTPDGTLTLTTYSIKDSAGKFSYSDWDSINHTYIRDAGFDLNQGVEWTTVTTRGQPNALGTAIVSGTRITTVANRQGQIKQSKTEDIETGYVLAQTEVTDVDDFGRPEAVQLLGGKTEYTQYNCCGVDSTTDGRGITTTYTKTSTESTVTVQGITTKTTQQGNTTIVTRKGTDGTWLEISRLTANLAGEAVVTYTRGQGLVTEAYSTDVAGMQIHTTTYQDAGTRIETSYQDGTVYSLTGTAVSPVLYEEGIQTGVVVDGVATTVRWRKQTALDAAGATTSEWTKTWTDFAGRVWKTESSSGAVVLRFYNAEGRLVKMTDADNIATLYAYNAAGELVTTCVDMNQNGVIDEGGTDRISSTLQTFTTHDGTPTGVKVRRTTQKVWNVDGSATPVTVSIHDAALDGTQSWTEVNGQTTRLYEQVTGGAWAGNWTQTTLFPDDSTSTDTFTGGRLVSTVRKDSANVVVGQTTVEYDAHGRLWKRTDGRGAVTTTTYESQPNPVSGGSDVTADLPLTVQSPPKTAGGTGPVTTMHYDTMGRNDKTTDALLGTVEKEYYPTGTTKRVFGSRSYPIEYTYTPQGRMKTMVTTTAAGPAVTTWEYHGDSGYLHKKKYGGTTISTSTYKPSGRLWTKTNARSITATYSYDNAGQVSSIDYSDLTPDVSFVYTRLGQPKSTTREGVTHVTNSNAFGELTGESWTGGDLDGVSLDHPFDAKHRSEGLTVSRNGSTLTSSILGYDDASRLKTVTTPGNGSAKSATYSYISQSSLIDSVVYKTDASPIVAADYEFDLAGHLKWINYASSSAPSAVKSTYEVDDIHRRKKVTREDSTVWDWDYNDRGELTGASRKFSDGSPVPMEQFGYTFDAIGNRLTSTAASRVRTYAPNALNQYDSRTNPGWLPVEGEADLTANVVVNSVKASRKNGKFWAEVPVNNASASVHHKVNVLAARPGGGAGGTDLVASSSGLRYVAPANETCSYDDDGNLLQDGRWGYVWDAENRLISMSERADNVSPSPDNPARRKLEFKYDAASRRYAKKVSTWNSTTSTWVEQYHTLFIWDAWSLVAELEFAAGASAPRLQRCYTWGLDMNGSIGTGGGGGGLLFEKAAISPDTLATAPILIPAYDGNGNVIGLLTDGIVSAVAARYEYEPFGAGISAIYPTSSSAARSNPIQFSTKYQDAETGLLYFGYRFYAPETGKWLSRDPAGEKGGINPYAFVGNNTVNCNDALGLWGEVGHFYGTFATSLTAGLSSMDAFAFAYYTQLPDQMPALDAGTLAKAEAAEPLGGFGRIEAVRLVREYIGTRNLPVWSHRVQDWLHSLFGEATTSEQRRCCILDMMKDPSLAVWEKGLLNHALGDSYAHIDPEGNAYDWESHGHGLTSVFNGAHSPDLIYERPERFATNMATLYTLLAPGKSEPYLGVIQSWGYQLKPVEDLWELQNPGGMPEPGSREAAHFQVEADWVHLQMAAFWNWLPPALADYRPEAVKYNRLDNIYPQPTWHQVDNLMVRMRRHCNR